MRGRRLGEDTQVLHKMVAAISDVLFQARRQGSGLHAGQAAYAWCPGTHCGCAAPGSEEMSEGDRRAGKGELMSPEKGQRRPGSGSGGSAGAVPTTHQGAEMLPILLIRLLLPNVVPTKAL